MKRLKTIFGVKDDLQEFAESWLYGDACLANAISLSYADGAIVSCLHRDGKFQVELCCVPPGFVIPDHTHPNADTIELNVAGVLRLHVNGQIIYSEVSDEDAKRLSKGRGIRINSMDVHGTSTPVGNGGAIFLSIQKWKDSPASVLTDYKGIPLGDDHQGMIK